MNLPTEFRESLRYEYVLTSNDYVIDLGAYHGTFAATIAERYGCHVHAYEPVGQFCKIAQKRLKAYPTVELFNEGVFADTLVTMRLSFGIKGDMTGLYTDSSEIVPVTLQPIEVILDTCPVDPCLLKLNIEGYEYDLLDHMLDHNLHTRCRNIQVQFHGNIPDCESRFQSIHDRLQQTYRLTYHFPYCWTNYERI